MSLLVLGVNHKSAPVAVRERLHFDTAQLPQALSDLRARHGVLEAAILSTCNRTEIYCCLEHTDAALAWGWLSDYKRLPGPELRSHLYMHPDEQAVRHALRVASGLDSLILGEPQILGQLKAAYQTAVRSGTIGKYLNRLFQHAFAVAKQVRTDTAIGSSPVSVAFAAVRLAQQIFGDLAPQTALLIGAGDTIELAARHLHENRLGRMIIANRSLERSRLLAAEFAAYAITLGELPAHLAEADIVISSTASSLPILGKGAVERALRARRHRPMFLVDIAVPRDIEPEIGELEDVYLYTVDDLESVIQENLQSRQAAALQAEEIIDSQARHYMDWLQSLNAVGTVRAVRRHLQTIGLESLVRARRRLARGDDPEQVLQDLARVLTNRLAHAPSVKLRAAGMAGRDDLLAAACELLGLEPDNGD